MSSRLFAMAGVGVAGRSDASFRVVRLLLGVRARAHLERREKERNASHLSVVCMLSCYFVDILWSLFQ